MIGVGCVDIGAKEKNYVNRVLESGLITCGPILDKFETSFAAHHGQRHGLMVNSGTDALRIALAALKEIDGWKLGDEVIVPALTFIATSNVVIQNGLVPVFVDVDPETFNIDPKGIESAITNRTKAIIPVHLFGLPCDMAPIMAIAKQKKLRVVEDSCESMGVEYQGRSVGSFGDVACFSTYAAHIITTGVGGLAITSDDHIASVMRSFANHGRDPRYLGYRDSKHLSPQNYASPLEHEHIIHRRFQFERIGYSSRVTQMEAALGLAQLERIEDIVFERQTAQQFLRSQLETISPLKLQHHPKDRRSACMMFPIVASSPSRAEMTLELERHGIETRPFFNILGQAPYLKSFGSLEEKFPIATQLSRNGFYVGCHQLLSPADLWQIVDSIKSILVNLKVAA